ncbi:Oidioi.mRNA.OKI2018_I69.chr2.g6664.t1.cds [Oikopleura dioica]|uniref:Oidioi.mRNA.OKI2018_I69.chr2.g6664.t1.cds n=1 Tax=Oikopleura dioica TaxID=34765 RepID=A0ABN7T8I8_OIKDI|nr:Oidioi.mRNA.OKI2018_I69.chr2.g6664.t1.cds [Oikopleura dioica]
MYGSPNKGPPGYYMLDSRYAHRAYFPQEYAEQRYAPVGGFVPAYSAHPSPHHPFMPWPAEQIPVFIPAGGHPDAFLGHNGEGLVRTESHNSSIDSRDSINSSGKKSNSRGRKSPSKNKYVPIKQRGSIQLAEIEEIAQQAERMRINDNSKSPRQRRNSGESGGSSNDSGVIQYSDEGDYDAPTQEESEAIIDQVEYYLSDEYLAKDKYLLRQIRCKSEGYISIKLMTSFKKVKKLTRDWRVVRHALKLAPQLEVSPEGYRVKRRDILPETLRKPRLLTSVVAIRVPPEFDSVDQITTMFREYGDIGLVRLLRPGKEVPSDLRNYATQVPDIGDSLCAVVDFESSEAALKAVRELKENFCETGMRLALLGPRMRRTLYRQDRLAAQGKLGSDDDKSIISGSCQDSGHGDNLSEISDDNSGKLSPGFATEKVLKRQVSQIREPVGPGTDQSRGFALARQMM